MGQMLGKWEFDVHFVAKEGIRLVTDVMVTSTMSPEEITIYRFPLVVTTDVLKTWGIAECQAPNIMNTPYILSEL